MSKLSRTQRGGVPISDPHPWEGLTRMQPQAAGLDIGAHEIMACAPGPNDTQDVRAFGTYTADLHALVAWLLERHVQTVAMESTGVYWIPVFETLEAHGLRGCLIRATAIHRIPGRKSDVLDCQWIQTLHTYGLLADSFRPDADLIALRTLLRHRAQLIEHRSPHILHMQKALTQMNIQLAQALSDVTGQTGQAIIRAIVAGERDPHRLAALRNYRCQKDAHEIALALTGTWRAEHVFVLTQSLECFDFYTRQLNACDAEIERLYTSLRPAWGMPEPPLPPQKPHSHNKNTRPDTPLRNQLRRLTGVDLVAVPGLSVSLAQTIVAEVGTTLDQFPDAKHFCSWLGLAPHNDISGGKVLKSRTLKNHNRAGQASRSGQAAAALMRAKCHFGAYYRRKKSQIGPAQAAVATAHKIARTVYHMLKFKVEYRAMSADEYDQQFEARELKRLQHKAAHFGLSLVPLTAAKVAVS